MKTARHPLLIVTSILLAFTALAAETNLEALKASYETQTSRIGNDAHATSAKLSAAYGRSLDRTIEALRSKGDPEPVITATAEKARFENDATVPNPPDEKLPQLIQDVQANYHEAVESAGTERDRRRASLGKKYAEALDRLMRKHTGAGRMDLAMEVKKEKERVEFEMADIESRLLVKDATPEKKTPEKGVPVKKRRVTPDMLGKKPLPEGTVEWNGHHYLLVDERLTWPVAKARCEEAGGHLVIMETREEWDFINDLRDGRDIMIGATDEEKEGTWRWVDGKNVGKWIPGNSPTPLPQMNGRDDYLHMWDGKKSGNWDDVTAGWSAGHVCEWEY